MSKKNTIIPLMVGFFLICAGLVAPKLATASFSISGDIIVYDVTHNSFCVAWEASISEPIASYQAELIVYDNIDGNTETSGSSSTSIAINANGVMAAKAQGLTILTQYYYRIKITEDGSNYYYYPSLASSLTGMDVTT